MVQKVWSGRCRALRLSIRSKRRRPSSKRWTPTGIDMDVDMNELRRRNLRTAIILAVIAVMFMFGVIAKHVWFM
ncbi:hypothetical protein GCM10011430_09430 [Oxalicibacterium solurbis]|uniref:Uncharacterized protein n=1 Tax=Oxalicibacterium solurbis TaxID=69280 RepID=A0A8J3AU99_9BURK|nr:hypothetical protein GCM10011430_09430 [Oxalicibacterium solurbis]